MEIAIVGAVPAEQIQAHIPSYAQVDHYSAVSYTHLLVPTTYELTSFYGCENELRQATYQLELNDTPASNKEAKR